MVQSYFNLENDIVQDSLDSIANISQKPIVVGGLAVQLHGACIKKLLRNTPDADLLIDENPTNYLSFLTSFFKESRQFLIQKGYKAQPKRGRLNNAVKVIKYPNRENEENFLLNLTHFAPGIFENFKDYVSRQLAYSTTITYSSSRQKVLVASLEEVIPLKLQRATRYGIKREQVVGIFYPSLIDQARRGNWGHLSSMPLSDWKTTLDRLQVALDSGTENSVEALSTYKLSKDIYDICFAARIISDSLNSFDKYRYEENVHRILDRNDFNISRHPFNFK